MCQCQQVSVLKDAEARIYRKTLNKLELTATVGRYCFNVKFVKRIGWRPTRTLREVMVLFF